MAGEELAPKLGDLNGCHVREGLPNTSANVKKGIVALDVAVERPARQRSQRIKMKNSRLEGYVVDAGGDQ